MILYFTGDDVSGYDIKVGENSSKEEFCSSSEDLFSKLSHDCLPFHIEFIGIILLFFIFLHLFLTKLKKNN